MDKISKSIHRFSPLLLSILGLSFWFFIGFPFANHNESYMWIVQFNKLDLTGILTTTVAPIVNFRPLGQLIAWLTYTLSGNAIYFQQLLNFLLAIAAWLLLYKSSESKITFSYYALIVTGLFFSGYIYLFHLHGVFYSPLLILLAFFIYCSKKKLNYFQLFGLLMLSALLSLIHPFAILFYLAFLFGSVLNNLRDKKYILISVIYTILSILIFLVLLQTYTPVTSTMISFSSTITDLFNGIVVSFRTLEVNSFLSIASVLLSLITVLTLQISFRYRLIGLFITFLLSALFLWANIPMIIIWLLICLIKTIYLKQWILGALILATMIMPAASATGSPTYAIFSLFIGSYIANIDFPKIPKLTQSLPYLGLGIIVVAFVFEYLLLAGINVPVISGFVSSTLQAEKEKTYQLEAVINWWLNSNYKTEPLVLCQSAYHPTDSTNAIDRKNRPPTDQYFLTYYEKAINPLIDTRSAQKIYACFGDEVLPGAAQVMNFDGKYSGKTLIFKK
jgi:hypothetical protein